MRAIALAAAAAIAVAPGCTSGADDVLAETAANLGQIDSGDMSLFVALTLPEDPEAGEVSFTLTGPFALAEEGGLPIAELDYVQTAGREQVSGSFVSTGDAAFVAIEEQFYELDATATEELRVATTDFEDDGGLGELRIEDWFREATVSEGSEFDGVETEVVTAELDVVTALNDLFELTHSLGASLGPLGSVEGTSAEQLEKAVESSRIEVVTGAEDRLMRALSVEINFGASTSELSTALGALASATFELDLELDSVNEPVEVAEPDGALPYSELGV